MIERSIQPLQKITEKYIEQLCVDLGLTLTMKGELKSMDSNTHWHYKQGKQKGVLEITWLHNSGKVLLQCKDGRQADWIFAAMDELEKRVKR